MNHLDHVFIRASRPVLGAITLLGFIACGGEEATTSGSGGGDGIVGAPAVTRAVAGDGQTAEVNTTLPVAPRMLVTDADGDPVPGVAIEFTVTVGDGTATDVTTETGDDGTAAVGSWTLGPVPGEHELTGEAAGLAPVLFGAIATPDANGSMLAFAGDTQYATVGTAVAVAPAVIVRDQMDEPIVGRDVTFTVTAGDGVVTEADAVTDAEGVARVGGWTLGAVPGDNTLTARTADLPDYVFRATAVSTEDPVITVDQDFLTGLDRPWDIAFAPDGAMFFTERGGRLRVLLPGASAPVTLAEPADVAPQTQSGMLGVAVDPEFATNRRVYVFTSSNRSGSMDNRIRRFNVDAGYTTATEEADILTGIAWGAEGGHSGGRIRFGPDGFLYVTSGDNRAATIPQDLTSLGSKVLRITTDGDPAPGNPNLGPGARPEIFAYGFRNPQGITFRPLSGQVFLCEHGPNQDDEVTRLVSGGNGGWNPNDGNGNYNGYTGAIMTDTSLPDTMLPGYVVSDSEGMCGCDFLSGTQWASWDGRLAIAMLAGRRMIVANFDAEGAATVGPVRDELENIERLRVVVQGPDGAAYIAVDKSGPGGAIWRLSAE
ncbi:MAG: PQQ-dependent sugar dehydrogenase [Myxococcota bacterium]